MFKSIYKDQVNQLLEVLPIIRNDTRFALKGGTAINLFHRNMPRLSVDIDLTYLPIEPRDLFLNNLSAAMQQFSTSLKDIGFSVYEKKSKSKYYKINSF